MERKSVKDKIISAVLFLVAFFVAIGVLVFFAKKTPEVIFPAMDKEKTQVLFLGDSNIDYGFEGEDVTIILKDKADVVTYNCAFGGTCAGDVHSKNNEMMYRSYLNFENLTRMMAAKDFSVALCNQKFVEDSSSGIENKALIMKHLDYDAMDYVVVHYGLNDYAAGEEPSGNDAYDPKTYAGGLRRGTERLHKICPNAKIIFSSITFCWFYDENDPNPDNEKKKRVFGYEHDFGGETIEKYRDAMKEVAEEYDYVYFLDNLETLGIDENNYRTYLRDNMHFSEAGRELYAEGLMEFMKEIETDQ